MVDPLSLSVAGASLIVSIVTLYLTLLRRGSLKMTRPTAIFFVRDGPDGRPKIVVTALLYSTSKKGQVVESLFVRLTRDGFSKTFSEWIYCEGAKVHLGGVKIGEEGRTLFDHFVLPDKAGDDDLLPGDYEMEVYATVVGKPKPSLLFRTAFALRAEDADAVRPGGPGLALLWDPTKQSCGLQVGPPKTFRDRGFPSPGE